MMSFSGRYLDLELKFYHPPLGVSSGEVFYNRGESKPSIGSPQNPLWIKARLPAKIQNQGRSLPHSDSLALEPLEAAVFPLLEPGL
jgi:hypothetical protein